MAKKEPQGKDIVKTPASGPRPIQRWFVGVLIMAFIANYIHLWSVAPHIAYLLAWCLSIVVAISVCGGIIIYSIALSVLNKRS